MSGITMRILALKVQVKDKDNNKVSGLAVLKDSPFNCNGAGEYYIDLGRTSAEAGKIKVGVSANIGSNYSNIENAYCDFYENDNHKYTLFSIESLKIEFEHDGKKGVCFITTPLGVNVNMSTYEAQWLEGGVEDSWRDCGYDSSKYEYIHAKYKVDGGHNFSNGQVEIKLQ
jgi:hypothetical protein